jgi:hypothetical protein
LGLEKDRARGEELLRVMSRAIEWAERMRQAKACLRIIYKPLTSFLCTLFYSSFEVARRLAYKQGLVCQHEQKVIYQANNAVSIVSIHHRSAALPLGRDV